METSTHLICAHYDNDRAADFREKYEFPTKAHYWRAKILIKYWLTIALDAGREYAEAQHAQCHFDEANGNTGNMEIVL